MNCKLIDDFTELSRYADDWDRLATASDFPNIFLSWGFNSAWWQAFQEDKLLRAIVVIDNNSKVRLIAPFYAYKTTPMVWHMIANFSGDYNDLIVADGDEAALMTLFDWLRKKRQWKEINIGRIPGHTLVDYFSSANHENASLLVKLYNKFTLTSLRVYRVWNYEHPHTEGQELLEMKGLLSTKNYIRHVNWFKRNGEFKFRTINDAKEIKKLLPDFMELHTREWLSKGMKAQFKWPLAKTFFYNITDEMAKYGTLQMNVLQFNSSLVAGHIGFKDRNRFYFYKPCFDPDYSKRSPGKILMAYMIQHAIDNNITDFDLLRGLDPYKARYGKSNRRTTHFSIRPPRLRVSTK